MHIFHSGRKTMAGFGMAEFGWRSLDGGVRYVRLRYPTVAPNFRQFFHSSLFKSVARLCPQPRSNVTVIPPGAVA